jgi:hypothetical protein
LIANSSVPRTSRTSRPYDLDRRRRHNRLLHAPGIAEGLQVSANINDAFVTVAAGTAYDALGQEIVLASSQKVNLSGIAGAIAYITIEYFEQSSDPSADPGVTGNTRISEQPTLAPSATLPANPNLKLVLASIALASGKVSAAPDNTVRNQAGAVLGDLTAHSVTLRNDAVAASTWPKLVCSAANTAALQNAGLTINGTVGIGTTAPGYQLDVADRIRLRQGSSPSAGLWLYQTATKKDQALIGMASDTQVGLWGNTGAQWGLVMDTSNGKVGIGTTTPGYLLDVAGQIRLRGDPSAPAGLWLYQTGTLNKDLAFIGMIDKYAGLIVPGYIIPTGLMMDISTANVGIGSAPNANKLYVNGNIVATGTITPAPSDMQFKTNVTPLTDVLNKIESIHGVRFQWNELFEKIVGHPSSGDEIGLVAQDVEKVFPELVHTWHDDGYKAIDYDRFTAVLVEAVKELKAKNEALEQRIEALEKSYGASQTGVAPSAAATPGSRSKRGAKTAPQT